MHCWSCVYIRTQGLHLVYVSVISMIFPVFCFLFTRRENLCFTTTFRYDVSDLDPTSWTDTMEIMRQYFFSLRCKYQNFCPKKGNEINTDSIRNQIFKQNKKQKLESINWCVWYIHIDTERLDIDIDIDVSIKKKYPPKCWECFIWRID